MTTVLAALDASPTARTVLGAAQAFGALIGATVEPVHVTDGGHETPEWVASQHDLSLRMLKGPVESTLLEAVEAPAVVAAVFGARRTPGGRRPAGHIAMHVLERATKPIVIVPPGGAAGAPRPYRRLLVPLEGDEESSRSVLARLEPLAAGAVDVIVLHVFTEATLPRALDRPSRDLSLWGDEFVARFCPDARQIELRTGPVGPRVSEVAIEERADLVVLSWSRDASPGHAAVVQEVLASSPVPILLLPIDGPRVPI